MWELAQQVLTIARQAGDVVMAFYDREYQIDMKEDHSPVTEADRAAHTVISSGLLALDGQFPMLSEEDLSGFHGADVEGCYWLVDPLDGTREYIKRNGEFTVNIALVCQGKPVLGVIHIPTTKVSYFGVNHLGAYKVTDNWIFERLPLVDETKDMAGVLRVVGSRSHQSTELMAWLEDVGVYQLHYVGSSLKFCLIAEGRADVYPRFGPTGLWDTAAGHVIVSESGGTVRCVTGEELSYEPVAPYLNPSFVVRG
ncbi:3'(2'),5'-bisphosphate nucleotidase CysQ [Vreelandella stevensii]|uniref:3'(2'),5'-bisphosphate nucleotidase CysQ n=1 Tax=Vreelandella stevensii TaxID=502821 RepID=UPI0037499164